MNLYEYKIKCEEDTINKYIDNKNFQKVGMGIEHSIFSVAKGKVVFKKSKSDRTYVSVKPN